MERGYATDAGTAARNDMCRCDTQSEMVCGEIRRPFYFSAKITSWIIERKVLKMNKIYLVSHNWFEGDGEPQESVTGGEEVFASKETAEAYIEKVYDILSSGIDDDVFGLYLRKGIQVECDRREVDGHDRYIERWEIWERTVMDSIDDLERIEL